MVKYNAESNHNGRRFPPLTKGGMIMSKMELLTLLLLIVQIISLLLK